MHGKLCFKHYLHRNDVFSASNGWFGGSQFSLGGNALDRMIKAILFFIGLKTYAYLLGFLAQINARLGGYLV